VNDSKARSLRNKAHSVYIRLLSQLEERFRTSRNDKCRNARVASSLPFSPANPPACGQIERVENHSSVGSAIQINKWLVVLLLFTFHVLLFTSSEAEIFDRVVAFVDDQAITLSGLQEQFSEAKKLTPDITEEEVLNTMINRLLLLREARKYSIEAPSKEEILNEYIDLKVRAFIKVSDNDIEEFYANNKDKFAGKGYEEVREEIEKYLAERELNNRLKETLKELREKAYVKIQLYPDG
jgi:hypothetical protein